MSTKIFDAVSKKREERYAKKRFVRAKNADKKFKQNLLAVARQIGAIVKGFAPQGKVKDLSGMTNALERYSSLLEPWAKHICAEMIGDVDKRNASDWMQVGKDVGRNLREELSGAPTGAAARKLMDEQVILIKSLPLDAAKRVHKLTEEGMLGSKRADEIAAAILNSGNVTASRAKLIARTEVARTASTLTQARAEFVGATAYVWETSEDGDVRPSHKKMQGEVVSYDSPPTLDGLTGHAGALPNCRCFQRPILPE